MNSHPPIRNQASCADSGKGDLLSVEEAEQRIFRFAQARRRD